MWQAWPLGTRLQSASMTHRRRRRTTSTRARADHDNNESLPQDVNDTWDLYYEGEEGQHEVEENWNDYDHSKSFQQFLQEDTTQLHFDIAAARQQQRNKKIEDTITHYIMYSNFKSYHHLLIDSGASTHVCPKDYAPEHQARSLQAGQLQDHDDLLRL